MADDGPFTATNYYDIQLSAGQEYQDYVAHRLLSEGVVLVNYGTKRGQFEHGENALGLEIKYDMKFSTTGNLWIETEERARPTGTYVRSGIFRDDNSWLYGIGNYEEFFLFSKRTLRLLSPSRQILENDRRTSRGFLLTRVETPTLTERMFLFDTRSDY